MGNIGSPRGEKSQQSDVMGLVGSYRREVLLVSAAEGVHGRGDYQL